MSSNNNDKLLSSVNTYGLPGNKYGLVDKQEQQLGLSELNLENSDPQVTQRNKLIYIDTRDCIGELSLSEAQLAFSFNIASSGKIPNQLFKSTLDSNSIVIIKKLIDVVEQLDRDPNSLVTGFPRIGNNDSYITDNKMFVKLPKQLKLVKNIDIINAIIPRDIIPIYVYFPGFIQSCLPYTLEKLGNEYLNPPFNTPNSTWESPIPETIEDFFDTNISSLNSNKLGGVYETPLRYWRCYTSTNSMSNTHTPPPYNLWNPPQDYNSNDPWPFQPTPIPQQRIPTYRCKNGCIFAGYGLYDLDDFPEFQQLQLVNGNTIEIPLRKLILKFIIPKGQFINGLSAESIIDNSKVNDFNDGGIVDNPLTQTGYGDYQRFIPGPGLGMNYQPNQVREFKSAPIDLNCSTYDPDTGYIGPMPVPFPTFRGNVWGPYGRPGDRFQNLGLQQTVDELYLNGDLDNLEGNPIIWPDFNPTIESYTLEYFIANLNRIRTPIQFNNFETSNNPNIKNAMRVQIEGGYGAVSVKIGNNTSTRGISGPLEINGLPNTQYDGQQHPFNPDIWITPRSENPSTWIDTLSGPQKPSIVQSNTFLGWMYTWRDIFPWNGKIYVPITAGGTGPMEYYDCENNEWKKNESFITESTGSSQWSCSPVIGSSNIFCLPTIDADNFEFAGNLPWGNALTIFVLNGGSLYTVQNNIPTKTETGIGTGITINIISVGNISSTTGIVNLVEINNSGSGYINGDIVKLFQQGSNNNCRIRIESTSGVPTDTIPEFNNFHYHDPLAVAVSAFNTQPAITQDYLNGADTCTNDSENNCTAIVGEINVCIGSSIADGGTACDDPRPTPDPPCLKKNEYMNLESPETEWNNDLNDPTTIKCRPRDNPRILQRSTYLNRRLSYTDFGANNGTFITQLINYRSLFISSVPDTDIIISIEQAPRDTNVQSLNSKIMNSNFFIPIRLSLGSTSGTLEYVEAVQGQLTSTGIYWIKEYNPPIAKLNNLTLSFFTYDGTPIPIERTLGFKRQFNEQAILFSSSIISSFIVHGSYTDFSPNLPPFVSNFTVSPSSVLLTGTSSSKSLADPFNSRLSTYTKRNLSLAFRLKLYENQNPGITHIINRMPNVDRDQNTSKENEDIIPLASNIDQYDNYDNYNDIEEPYNEFTDDDSDIEDY